MKAILDTDAIPVEFPVRYVVGSLVIIAILGARYVILLSHGKKRMEEYAKQAQPEPTPSERRIGRPPKQTGVKTKADFKFIVPLAMNTTNENQAFAPSPFKPLTTPPAEASNPEDQCG